MVGNRKSPRRRMAVVALGIVSTLIGLVAGPAGAVVSETPDNTWGANGRVYVTLEVGNRVYIGGVFTAAVSPSGGTVSRNHLMAIDTTTGQLVTNFAPNPNGVVRGLAASADGSVLYVGGSFGSIGGSSRRNLAAISTATGQTLSWWRADTNAKVATLAIRNDLLYAGGWFTSVNDGTGTYSRSLLAAVDPANGRVDQGWNPVAAGGVSVRSLAVSADGARVFVAGEFTTVNGASRPHLAAVAALNGTVDLTFKPAFLPITIDVATDGARVYVALGGAGGEARGLDAVTGAQRWYVHGDGDFQAVGVFGGLVYVGGHFDNINVGGTIQRKKIFAVDPASGALNAFNPYINSALGVFEISVSAGGGIFLGGDFTRISNVSQPRFARLSNP